MTSSNGTSAMKRKLTDACTCSTSEPKAARVVPPQNNPPSLRSYSQKCHCCCVGPTMQPPLAESCRSYLASGIPARVMYYGRNQWCTFAETALRVLINGFKEDKSSTIVFSEGQTLLVDFLSMTAVNLKTGKQRSIAWIDEAGKCFFPPVFMNQEESSDDVRAERFVERALRESQPSGVSAAEMLRKKIKLVERDSQVFLSIQELFLSGMGPFGTAGTVLQIHHYQPDEGDDLAQSRLEEFERRVGVKEGGEGVRRGWFGCGKREIARVLIYGFSMARKPNEGIYGTDLYLMPEDRAFASVNLCDVDEKGLQYMLLCRVVPNFPKEADDGLKSKYYFVPLADSDNCIYPQYVISFKLSPVVREYLMGLNCMQLCEPRVSTFVPDLPTGRPIINREVGPTSPWMTFPGLFAAIGDNICPIARELLRYHHEELKKKRITREELVKKIRIIVGDQLLRSTLTNLQRTPSAWKGNAVAIGTQQPDAWAAASELISAPPVSVDCESGPIDTSLSVAVGPTNLESGTSHAAPPLRDSPLPVTSHHGTESDAAVQMCYLSIEQGMKLNNAAIDSILRAAKLEPGP